ncbi:MAG TPA: hypothetical protein PKA98_15795, partial [Acidimicrobiales bacterium]|nr:hypothetical protein [Acidimicrobiales bacterium]
PRLSPRQIDEASRAQVAAAVAATSPRLVVHGHWHHRYSVELTTPAGTARVEGLASNLEGDATALLLLDTAALA